MSKEFQMRFGIDFANWGTQSRVWSCVQRQCGGAAIEGLLLTILWLSGETVFHILGPNHIERARITNGAKAWGGWLV